MENQKKDFEVEAIRTRSRENSVEITQYFRTSNRYLEEKNEKSLKRINELETEKNNLIEDFQKKYNISFESAQNAKRNSWHSERDFNLDEFNKIEAIIDKINGEKFFIHQRTKLIEKNENVIEDILNSHRSDN